MKIKKGDILRLRKPNGDIAMNFLYCGKIDIDSDGKFVLYNLDCHKRLNARSTKKYISINFFLRGSKYLFDDYKVEVVKNAGIEKADEYLDFYKENFKRKERSK